MRAWELQGVGGSEELKLVDRPKPQPAFGQILVRVRAASLNFRDLIVMQGAYGRVSLPLVPLSDGAGEIAAIGEGVTQWKLGDGVAGTFFPHWLTGPSSAEKIKISLGGGSTNGMLAEYVLLDEEAAVRIPPHQTFEEAATMPCAALTAWNALIEQGNLKAGETVVIIGTGGVSLFGLQIAKWYGAKIIVLSSSDKKIDLAIALGADAGINYSQHPQWERKVVELTGGLGADHILEVGGAGTLAQSLRAARVGGHIAMIGILGGTASELRVTDILMNSLRINGIYVGSREMFERLNRAAIQHRLKPIIDRVFPLLEARSAYDYLKTQKHFGKIIISLA